MKRYQHSPLFELRVDNPVGESFTTDTDAFKYTVTLQLMQHHVSVNIAWKRYHVIGIRNINISDENSVYFNHEFVIPTDCG